MKVRKLKRRQLNSHQIFIRDEGRQNAIIIYQKGKMTGIATRWSIT